MKFCQRADSLLNGYKMRRKVNAYTIHIAKHWQYGGSVAVWFIHRSLFHLFTLISGMYVSNNYFLTKVNQLSLTGLIFTDALNYCPAKF